MDENTDENALEAALKKAAGGAWKRALLVGLISAALSPLTSVYLGGGLGYNQDIVLGLVLFCTFIVGAVITAQCILQLLKLNSLDYEKLHFVDPMDLLKLFIVVSASIAVGIGVAYLIQEITRPLIPWGAMQVAILGEMMGGLWVIWVAEREIIKSMKSD